MTTASLRAHARTLTHHLPLTLVLSIVIVSPFVKAADRSLDEKLKGLDAYMAQLVKDWNAPGIGVGVVVKDKLVFAKG
ncbi:MAG: hypothetical protein LC753_19745 [Acidobacteria bacterium]|nr:hypothetical protein [Acidobacteriota bacterium]